MKNIPLHEVRSIDNLKDMINSSVELFGDKPAYLVKRQGSQSYEPILYKEFLRDVNALGTSIINLGLKDKKIAVIGENRYEWIVSYLAVINGTGIIVPLDKELPENEIEILLKRAKVSAVIYSDVKKEQIKNIAGRIDFVDYYISMDADDNTDSLISFKQLIQKGNDLIENENDRSYIDAKIDNFALASLLFTSGTTDKSKAVMLSQENLRVNLMAMLSMLYIDPSDVFLSVLPIHHTYECTCGFLCQMFRGTTVAFCEGLRHIPKNMQETKTTVMLGVPLIFEAMYKRIWDQAGKDPKTLKKLKLGIKISNILKKVNIDVTRKLFAPIHQNFGGHIRLFISGAAGIDPIVAKGLRSFGINIVQGYGLTECAPIVALNRSVDFKDDAGGLPLPGLEVRIDSPGEDNIGEITVKGPSVMIGYYEDPELTAKVIRDGWFYTGDLGFIDSDGFVHITGRKKDVIVTKNGKNIYPEEIETLLNRSEYIKEALVYGKDDKVYGDVVITATIVPDMDAINETFKEKQLTEEEVYELIHKEVKSVNKSLVTYKYIRDFQIRENEFAKTTTKKIKRYMEKLD